jgi:outer membrane protein TolC
MQPYIWHVVALASLAWGQPVPGGGPSLPAQRAAELIPSVPIIPDSDSSSAPAGPPGVSQPSQIQVAPLGATEHPLPINLATALRLSDARPLVVEAARASLEVAAAQLERANVLWMPSLYAGIDYFRHDGGFQSPLTGNLIRNSRQSLLVGPGVAAVFAVTDAVYEPLAARQVLRSRQADLQSAKNDALLLVAESYFNVQQARGRFAGARDTVVKSKALVSRVTALGQGLTAPIEVDRALTQLAELEQVSVSAQEDWRVASATLTRVLRLDPTATVLPMEPPHLQITLIDPQASADALVPIGLTSRPELASRQALVQATLARLKQERMRPLIPSIVLTGDSGSNGPPLAGGFFAGAPNASLNESNPRFDMTAQLLWELRNLGFGNQGLVRERRGQEHQALVDLFQVQDTVAAEVAQALAQLQSAAARVGQAQTNLSEGLISFAGNFKGIGETTRFGDVLQLVIRPQEAVAALQQLDLAYRNYFTTVADYNRAQFRLYHALGYPAGIVACERPPGEVLPVDARRPPQMAPVIAPEPCSSPAPGPNRPCPIREPQPRHWLRFFQR